MHHRVRTKREEVSNKNSGNVFYFYKNLLNSKLDGGRL